MNRQPILRPSKSIQTLYLYRWPVDFRKSHRGLAALVEREFRHNPHSGSLYVFRNKASDKIKMLMWENNGFVLYYKSLAEEKFHWPKDGQSLQTLNGEPLNWLLDGYDIGAMKPHRTIDYESAN